MEKLIVVLHLNVGGLSRVQAQTLVNEQDEYLKIKFQGENVIYFVIPTEGETRMECLNSKQCSCKDDKKLTQQELMDYTKKLKSLYNNDKETDINKNI